MPRPEGLVSRTFASDAAYDLTPGKPWSEAPNKTPHPDLGQGFTPGERPSARFVNHELHGASLLRFMDDMGERNWGPMYLKSDFQPVAIDYLATQHIYVAASGLTSSIWASHNGSHWDEETTASTDEPMCDMVVVGAYVVYFEAITSAWHTRNPSAYGAAGFENVAASGSITLWNRVASGGGVLEGKPHLVDPDEAGRLWHLYSQTVSGTKRIGISRMDISGTPTQTLVAGGEIELRTSFVWDEDATACMAAVPNGGARLVFGTMGDGSNQIWVCSNLASGYLEDWARVDGHSLLVSADVGRIVGAWLDETDVVRIATSLGRVYRANDSAYEDWTRIDAALPADYFRTFKNATRVEGSILAQGNHLYTGDSYLTEGYFISRDQGQSWDFVGSPIDYRQSSGHPDVNMFRPMTNGQLAFWGTRVADDHGAWALSLKTRSVK